MADDLLDRIRDLVDGHIDFEGQRLVELLIKVLLSTTTFISFVLGYLLQDITLAVRVGLAGTALTFLVAVPPWPIYKQHPIKWYGERSIPQVETVAVHT